MSGADDRNNTASKNKQKNTSACTYVWTAGSTFLTYLEPPAEVRQGAELAGEVRRYPLLPDELQVAEQSRQDLETIRQALRGHVDLNLRDGSNHTARHRKNHSPDPFLQSREGGQTHSGVGGGHKKKKEKTPKNPKK